MKPVNPRNVAHIGAYDSDDKFTLCDAHTPHGVEDGDNSPPGIRSHESGHEPRTGTDAKDTSQIRPLEQDALLRTSEVIERFRRETRTRLRPKTQKDYSFAFRRFSKEVGLDKYTRRQLNGQKGRLLILDYLQKVPKPSWKWTIAALKVVWLYGVKLTWPIDSKRDLPKLPRTRQMQTPPDSVLLKWHKAMENEPDPYYRLLWLFIAQFGWRPSHVRLLKWRNLQLEDSGKSFAIIADGTTEGFKSSSPVAVRLPPNVVNALEEWMGEIGRTEPDLPILPWRSANGILEHKRHQAEQMFNKHWRCIEHKWRLPYLRPSQVRHWVATTARKAGLSKQATAYLMGHDPTQGGSMRDWYDSPQLADIFIEQEDGLPNGPLGLLDPPVVEFDDGLPREAISLLNRYLAGEIGGIDLLGSLERIRLELARKMATEASL